MKQLIQWTKKNLILFAFFITCLIFAIPSIKYYIANKTILRFSEEFKFLLTDNISRIEQTLIYIIILVIMTVLYLVILKKRKEIFLENKKMFIFIILIALIFIVVIPFTSSDIFYYLGIGRLNSEYGQNPYYISIKQFIESGDNYKILENDTVMQKAYVNVWSGDTVVYGAVWTLICRIISIFSFGNIDIGLFVFKLANVMVHVLNCYLIYKISNKKIFTLIYGINPYILIEGIACVHNDIFMILFILLSLYFITKKKNLVCSIIFLAVATAIKYFTVILLPFIIIYYFRKEKTLVRFIKCLEYGMLFLIITAIPYLLYIRDIQVFSGIIIQQEKLAKSFYVIITEYFNGIERLPSKINKFLLGCFSIIYFFTCVILLNKKEIKFREEIKKANYFIIFFLFLLITNFQTWYIMWLFPCIIWQRTDIIKFTINVSLISQFANSVFLAYGESWRYGTPFTFIMCVATLGIMCFEKDRKIYKHKKKAIMKLNER